MNKRRMQRLHQRHNAAATFGTCSRCYQALLADEILLHAIFGGYMRQCINCAPVRDPDSPTGMLTRTTFLLPAA